MLLRIFNAGKTAAMAEGMAEGLRRTIAANKARAKVDQSSGALDNDPYNRDRR